MSDIRFLSEDCANVFSKDAKLEKVESGFTFTEGPIWHPTEHWIMFSDIAESTQYKWSEASGLEVFRKPTNQANGNCFDQQGRVITCEHASSQVTRHDHNGKLISVLASHYQGKELNSPNDVVCDNQGRIWFTDPSFGRIQEPLGILRDQELDFMGVFRLDPDGTLTVVVDDFVQPNGLCLSLDQSQLYVNDSRGDPCIRKFDITDDGMLTNDTLFCDIGKDGIYVPDGMKMADNGYIICNGWKGILIINPLGEIVGTIDMPEKSTNFCFGGPDRDWLYITASSTLYRIKTATTGAPMIPATAQ